MAWPTLMPPTAGTVITVAREVAMNNDPLTWLRLLTGNADPPGPNYVVVSSGAASTAWAKVSGDVLAPGAAVANLGYTPLNRDGDVSRASLTVSQQNLGSPADGVLYLGQTGGAVYVAKLGTSIYLGGLPVIMNGGALSITNGNLNVSGDVFITRPPAGTVGSIRLAGHELAWDGVRLTIDTQPIIHAGTIGAQSVNFATSAGSAGSASTAGDAAALGGRAPGNAANQIPISNGVTNASLWATRAENVGGHTPTATPTANAIPIADATGHLDAWVTPTAAAPVPSGLIAFIPDGAVPSGWNFYTPANGRVIVAAGTASVTNAQAFTVGTSYGPDWMHAHTVNINHAHSISATHTHGASALGVTGSTGGPSATNGLAAPGGTNLPTDTHTHGSGTLDVNGTTDAATSSGTDNGGSTTQATTGVIWIPPSHALNAIRKA